MCVGCFVVSAFTLFMPATEAPVPLDLSTVSQPAAHHVAVLSEITAPISVKHPDQTELAQLRQALGDMVAAFPSTPESALLRTEFGALHQQLQATNDLAIANQILDEGFAEVKEKILAAPNADELINIMYEIREARFEQMQAFAPLLPGLKMGWLS